MMCKNVLKILEVRHCWLQLREESLVWIWSWGAASNVSGLAVVRSWYFSLVIPSPSHFGVFRNQILSE